METNQNQTAKGVKEVVANCYKELSAEYKGRALSECQTQTGLCVGTIRQMCYGQRKPRREVSKVVLLTFAEFLEEQKEIERMAQKINTSERADVSM
jgi:hypothetical protein